MLTQARLKEVLLYDPESGLFTWIKVTSNRVKIGQVAGSSDDLGYVHIRIDGKKYLAHQLAWLYVNGAFPGCELDHRDRNPSNNRIENLRIADRFKNNQNTAVRVTSKSRIKGVSFDKARNKWAAEIIANGKKYRLGRFDSIEAAAAARQEASERLHGEFSCL